MMSILSSSDLAYKTSTKYDMKVTRDLHWSQKRGISNAREMGRVQKKYFV